MLAQFAAAELDMDAAVNSIDPVDDQAADINGASAQLSSLVGEGVLIGVAVGPGVFTPTASNKLEVEVEESVDDSVWTDAPNASLSIVGLTTLAAAATNVGTIAVIDATNRDDKVYFVNYVPSSTLITHVRTVGNFTGTVTGGIPLATFIVGSGQRGVAAAL